MIAPRSCEFQAEIHSLAKTWAELCVMTRRRFSIDPTVNVESMPVQELSAAALFEVDGAKPCDEQGGSGRLGNGRDREGTRITVGIRRDVRIPKTRRTRDPVLRRRTCGRGRAVQTDGHLIIKQNAWFLRMTGLSRLVGASTEEVDVNEIGR